MTALPPSLNAFAQEAKKMEVKAIEFSGRTYQVNVWDPKAHESYWSFLHLAEGGTIAESFCQCSDETENSSCAHLAKAFIQIYNNHPEPLHVRYENSFWRALFLILDRKIGSDPKKLKKTAFFNIKSLNPKGEVFLKELVHRSIPPTEETSLKFSDLTEEELEEIRQGHITPKLHYEFSFWSDLAKYFLNLQENSEFYSIEWITVSNLPLKVALSSTDIHVEFSFNEKELIELIPYLNTVESPLKKIDQSLNIQEVIFNPEKEEISLKFDEEGLVEEKGISFDSFVYLPKKGFKSSKSDPLLKNPVKDIEPFLDRFGKDIQSFISIDVKPHIFSHTLEIKKGDLILKPYLFTPGDLSGSLGFGKWIYLKGKGFFRLLSPENHKTIIPKTEVYDFVMTHAPFLNSLEGFQVHLTPLESYLSYTVDEGGNLTLQSLFKTGEELPIQAYGSLLYVPGQGFFSKSKFDSNLPVDNPILQHDVSFFIKKNETELKLIPHFFLTKTPFKQAKLDIIAKKGEIDIVPCIEWEDEFKHTPHRFYDDFLYLEQAGFYPLSHRHFIPAEFRTPRVIKPKDYVSFITKTLKDLEPFIDHLDPKLKLPRKLDLSFKKLEWNETEKGYETEILINHELPLEFTSGRFQFTKIGLIDQEDSRLKNLKNVIHDSYPYLSALQILKLLSLEEINAEKDAVKTFDEFLKMKTSLPLHHESLKSVLRPYQEKGVEWLWFLYTHRLSGLLCDDMGLGKTHQAMGLMAAIQAVKKGARFLVVCPTSVLHHWEDKLKIFFPTLKQVTYHGLKRNFKDFESADLLLTSYGILRNEISHLKNIPFDLAVLDEIQMAKNHLSRLHSSLRQIKSTTLIGLTGTPLENRVRELKALFDIVLPGLMPSETEYLNEFIKPIEREENPKSKASLTRLIKPFLLRRKKEDVLLDLPEKIEEISHADLINGQEKIYHELLLAAKQGMIKDLFDDKKLIPYIHIFSLLSSLKKICDHPALYLKKTDEYKKYHSGKWELFKELLKEALDSEQKVVVFSHFLGMLDIIESYLAEEGIGFAKLRGSTVNRKEEIHRFQNDPACKVFVASLQAGGLGIDLTQASVVIHYDRWWNAARENQATDRVHRIGQTRGVQVFKLVTLKSVEERIHEMIERKAKRMEEIVGQDDSQVIKALSREDLMELLRT